MSGQGSEALEAVKLVKAVHAVLQYRPSVHAVLTIHDVMYLHRCFCLINNIFNSSNHIDSMH